MSMEDKQSERGAGGGGKRSFFRRKKSCPFSGPNAPEIDWKNVRMMSRHISERGKMIPSRITAVSQKKQRELAVAIKRARYMGLMPYVRLEQAEQGRSFGQREPREYREPREPREQREFRPNTNKES